MKNLTYSFVLLLFLTACKKVELDFLAFPSEKLTAYQFEEYDAGDQSVPEKYKLTPSDRTLIEMNSVDAKTGETYKIYGVYIGDTATISTDTIIMYCHGQALHMDIYYPRASLLAHVSGKLNYGVFMMDYRGFGMSEGSSSEQGLYDDVDVCIDWLKQKGANPAQTIFYGFSLGCIPVIDRAAYRTDFKPTKIILESPLASVENLTHSSLLLNVDPLFVSSLVFNNAEKIKDVEAPFLWLHGIEDDYIAIENGELIFSNYQGTSKEAIRVEGAGHGDIPAVYGFENYINKLTAYCKKD